VLAITRGAGAEVEVSLVGLEQLTEEIATSSENKTGTYAERRDVPGRSRGLASGESNVRIYVAMAVWFEGEQRLPPIIESSTFLDAERS
jgi:hypothetical protein